MTRRGKLIDVGSNPTAEGAFSASFGAPLLAWGFGAAVCCESAHSGPPSLSSWLPPVAETGREASVFSQPAAHQVHAAEPQRRAEAG